MVTTSSQEPHRAQMRRSQVLQAAARCFRLYGFHGCSMAQLAKEAGMSVGHIYHYFENKEAIIKAIVQQDLEEWLVSMARLLDSQDVFQKILDSLEEPVQETQQPDYAALQIEIIAEAARNPRVAHMVHTMHRQVRDTVGAMLIKGSRRPLSKTEIDSKYELLSALFDGLMVRAIRSEKIDIDGLMAIMRPTIRFILDH